MNGRIGRAVASIWAVHAIYDLVTGIWSLVGIESFQQVTGRKTDLWLVKTVGILIVVIGGTMGAAGLRRRVTPEIAGLAIGSTAALATIDVVYVSQGRISKVYLLDALASVFLIGGWVFAWRRKLLPGQ